MERLKSFLFENTSNRQTIIKNAFWLFAGEASGRLLKMALIVYAARTLGAQGWGIFAYAISAGSLLMIFSDMGISSIITRDATQKKEGYRNFISTALLFKSIILLASVLLVVLVTPYISNVPEARALFPIIAIIFLFDSIRDIGFAINRILEKMEREMVVKGVMNLLVLILGIALIKINPEPKSVAISYAVGGAVSVCLLAFMLRDTISEFIARTDLATLKLVIKTAFPLAIVALIGTIMANTDIYMLGIWRTTEDIGIYSAAQRFYQFILIIPSMIATATLPFMARLANNDNARFRAVLEKTLDVFMVIGLPIAIGGVILASDLMPLVFGREYIEAVPVLRVLMIMLVSAFPLVLLTNAIFVYNEQKKLVVVNIFGVILNVILNFLLIPKLGTTGSAIATLASSTLITAAIWIKMKNINYFETWPTFKKIVWPVAAMSLATLALHYLGIHVVLNVLISAVVYFYIIFLTKKELLEEIKSIVKLAP